MITAELRDEMKRLAREAVAASWLALGSIVTPGQQLIALATSTRFGLIAAQFTGNSVANPRALDVSGAPTIFLTADSGAIGNGFVDVFTQLNGCATNGIAVRAGETWSFDFQFSAASSAANAGGFDIQLNVPFTSLLIIQGNAVGTTVTGSKPIYQTGPAAVLACQTFDSSATVNRPNTLNVILTASADFVFQLQIRNNLGAGTHVVRKGSLLYGTRVS